MGTSEDKSLSLDAYLCKGRILLIGGYGVGNYGDEAILAGLLASLSDGREITAVSYDPSETSALHHVDSVYPYEICRELGSAKSIVVSGGLFSSNMGLLGMLVPLFNLISSKLQVEILYHGLGVYPNTPAYIRPFLKASMKTASLISVRDRLSEKTLSRMGVRRVRLVQDLSFNMLPAPRKHAISILKAEGLDMSKRILGISITRANPKLSNKVTITIRDILGQIGSDWEVLMLPIGRHKKKPWKNDLLYSELVARDFPKVKFLRHTYHPSDILSIFGVLDTSICMRLHSMIFAWRMGVDMIPIPYDDKCSQFLRETGVKPATLRSCDLVKELHNR